MYNNLRVGAVVVAAGQGSRMGGIIKKQYINIAGKPMLAHTLSAVSVSKYIDEIIVVTGEDEIEYCRENIIVKYGIPKVSGIIHGGKERQQSIFEGLKELKDRCDIVVTHDGARPFASPDMMDESIIEANRYGAAACAVAVKDTIKVADRDGFVIDTPERSRLFAVQTPQTFKFQLLYKAHIHARDEGFVGTDDTVLVERIGTGVRLFNGSYENIKVTTPGDVYIAEAIIKYRENLKKQDK
jgi:2-C-methyl-D-erythritol 4-phosphate cytidylyltransferase